MGWGYHIPLHGSIFLVIMQFVDLPCSNPSTIMLAFGCQRLVLLVHIFVATDDLLQCECQFME